MNNFIYFIDPLLNILTKFVIGTFSLPAFVSGYAKSLSRSKLFLNQNGPSMEVFNINFNKTPRIYTFSHDNVEFLTKIIGRI